MNKLKSRKLWVAIGGVLTALGAGLAGAVEWPDVMKAITACIVGYLASQGVTDAAGALAIAKKTPLLILCALLIGTGGCATFKMTAFGPDGVTPVWSISDTGAPLLSRKSNFDVKMQWLDEATNTLKETTVKRNTDEKADPQVQALRLLGEYLKPAATAAGVPPLPIE